MNYLKVYVKLMKKARQQPEPSTYEKHHVFPKSLYGKNNYIVKLSPKQHYIAHALLYKGLKQRYGAENVKTKKMMHAFWFMHSLGPRNNNRYTSARLYDSIRTEFLKNLNDQAGKRNAFFGKKHSVLIRRKLSLMNGGTGQVDGLFEYFEEKFEKILGKKRSARLHRVNSKSKICSLETMLEHLSAVD